MMTTASSPAADPRVPGGRYFCGYAQLAYQVLAAERRQGFTWFACAWADGTVTTHATAWDPRRDVVLAQP
jgi:hypothetical protein